MIRLFIGHFGWMRDIDLLPSFCSVFLLLTQTRWSHFLISNLLLFVTCNLRILLLLLIFDEILEQLQVERASLTLRFTDLFLRHLHNLLPYLFRLLELVKILVNIIFRFNSRSLVIGGGSALDCHFLVSMGLAVLVSWVVMVVVAMVMVMVAMVVMMMSLIRVRWLVILDFDLRVIQFWLLKILL